MDTSLNVRYVTMFGRYHQMPDELQDDQHKKGKVLTEQIQNEVANTPDSLIGALRILKKYRWLLFSAPIIGAIGAAVVITQLRTVWEASALIQVGQVGQVVEPASRTVARVQNPSFAFRVFGQSSANLDEDMPAFSLYKASFKARQLPNTDLIELKVRGYSKDDAQKLILATVNQLRVVHDEMMKPSIDRLEQELAEIEKGARDNQNIVNELSRRLVSGSRSSDGSVLYVMLIQQKLTEIRTLMDRKLALQEQIHPARTFSTKLVGEIFVSKNPVSPNKKMIIFMMMLLAFFGAMLAAYMHHSMVMGRHDS